MAYPCLTAILDTQIVGPIVSYQNPRINFLKCQCLGEKSLASCLVPKARKVQDSVAFLQFNEHFIVICILHLLCLVFLNITLCHIGKVHTISLLNCERLPACSSNLDCARLSPDPVQNPYGWGSTLLELAAYTQTLTSVCGAIPLVVLGMALCTKTKSNNIILHVCLLDCAHQWAWSSQRECN